MLDPFVQLLLLGALGLAFLLFGFQFFRVLVVFAAAAAGFAWGPVVVAQVTGTQPGPAVALGSAVALAVLFALLAWLLYQAAVFLWGATVGFAAVAYAGGGEVLALIVGLGVGALALVFVRPVLVALTALTGAWLLVSAGLAALGAPPATPGLSPVASGWVPLAITVVLAVLGAIAQLRASRPRRVYHRW